jgi:hypothetical protein
MFDEIKMDAEIGSYQVDRDNPEPERPSAEPGEAIGAEGLQ